MKNALILAAGRSSRFGRNKLEERFEGRTLPYWAAKFALENGAEQIFLTLSRSAVKTNGFKVYHPVLEDVKDICDPLVRFQNEDTYGPGAAITTWSGVITEPFTVLFGDNFYRGTLDPTLRENFGSRLDSAVEFTYQVRGLDPRNLQLAAVIDNYVIEKPHGQLGGKYFCGLVRFPSNYLDCVGDLRKSDRGEVEIADMINMAPFRNPRELGQAGVTWGDLTYEADCNKIREIMSERK